MPQNNFILKAKTTSFFLQVKIHLGGAPITKDPVFSSNHQVLISNLPPSCCTNTHSWSHWKQRIAHASIHMHRCFWYFCFHLVSNFTDCSTSATCAGSLSFLALCWSRSRLRCWFSSLYLHPFPILSYDFKYQVCVCVCACVLSCFRLVWLFVIL